MILRKPYAFLVKHFRLIHAVLLMLIFFVFFQVYDILGFFNTYIGSPTSIYDFEIASKTLINFYSTFFAILVLGVSGILVYLLRYKKKPVLLYVVIIIIYSIFIASFILLPSFVYGMGYNPPSQILVRILRDTYLISLVAQVVLMIMIFVRAIGFDIKKFDFKRDVQDLGITDEDNEEFEFELNIDKEDYISKLRRRVRYLKYFYKENKMIFYVGYAAVAIFLVYSLVSFLTSLEHVYHENEAYTVGNLKFTVLESYNTTLNSKGNRINDKYFYTIVKVRVFNASPYQSSINTNNIQLYHDRIHSSTPNKLVYENFKEYGVQYYNQILAPRETRDFIFIFESPIESYNNSIRLRTLYSIQWKDGSTVFNYRTVRLSPKHDANKTTNVVEKSLGEEMSFEGSMLGKTTIKINDFEMNDSFTYRINKCVETKCSTQSNFITASSNTGIALTVMRLNYEIKYDYNTLGKNYAVNDFLARFARIRYVIDGIKNNEALSHNIAIEDLTTIYTNKVSFIEVKNVLKRADIIYLDFVIKDKVYTYKIKDVLKETQDAKAKDQLGKIEEQFGK